MTQALVGSLVARIEARYPEAREPEPDARLSSATIEPGAATSRAVAPPQVTYDVDPV